MDNNIEQTKRKLMNALEEAIEELAVMEVADIQANTLVDSGTLRRSIASETDKTNDTVTLTVGVDGSFVNNKNGSKTEDYAMKVEYDDKSYIRDTLKADKEQIIDTIERHLRGLWYDIYGNIKRNF